MIFRVFSDSAHRSPLRLHSTKRARPSRPSQFTSTIGYSFTQVPRAYRIPQVLKLWRDPATFTCGPSPPASYFRTPLMAKNGIGILSVSLERLRIDTWDGWDCVDKPGNVKSIHNKDEPTVAVAVNFGAPAPLDALDAKFPDGRSDDSLQKIVNASCPSWHGMQLKSLADILHVEIRESRTFDDSEDPRAIVSLPVASVIESAFVNSDGDGAKRDISFESPDCKTSGTVTIRLKFHLQADVLAALAKGVGLEDATGASVVAADTLAAVKLGILKPDKETERRRMEADEADAFKQNNKNGKGSANNNNESSGYSSMTAGIKRFLSAPKSPAKKHNQFVNLLANCELPAAQRSRGRAKSRVVVKA